MTEQALVPEATAALAATAASSRVAVTGSTKLRRRIRIVNSGPNTAFIKIGDGTVNAAVTDHPILNASFQDFTMLENQTHVAAICAATQTAALAITEGSMA